MAKTRKPYIKKLNDAEKVIKLAKERYKRGRDSQATENQRFKHNMQFTYQADFQWDEAMRKQRRDDGRPCLSVNRMPVFVRSIVNNYKQNSSGVKVLPVDDGADKEVAEILTGLIRNIETQSNATQIKAQALGYAVAGNKGFYRIITDYITGTFEQQIRIEPIVNTLSVTYDCDDTSLDGSGWKWGFIEDEISKEEFEERYPDEDPEDWPTDDGDWTQDSGKKIRIAEYFYKEMRPVTLCLLDDGSAVRKDDLQEGMNVVEERESEEPIVKWCVLGGNASEPLETKEWAGQYIPIIPVWGDQQWINGKRELYCALEYSQDAQRMLNFFRSSEAELLSLQSKAPYMVTPEQIEGLQDEWAGANSVNKPYLLYNAVQGANAPMRQGFAAPPSGVLQGAANAAQDIMDTSGIQEAGLGMQSNETSGRAINARAAQGDKASFQFLDNIAHADRYCGVVLVDLIPRIIDTPRVVRTLGVDGSEVMKKVNQEVEEKTEYGQTIKKIYDLGVGKYDVVVSSSPNFNSLRQEGQQMLTEMVQGNPQLMQQAGDIIFKTMDIPYAEELSERLKKFLPEGIAPPAEGEQEMPPELKAQLEQMQQAMQQMDEVIGQQQQALQDKQAEEQIKQAELEIKMYDSETKRMALAKDSAPVAQPATQLNPDEDLSEADKLEIQVAKDLRLKEMDHEHDIKKTVLSSKLARKEQIDEAFLNGDADGESETLADGFDAIIRGQQALADQILQSAANMERIAALVTAPKRLIRDESGRPIGAETVL